MRRKVGLIEISGVGDGLASGLIDDLAAGLPHIFGIPCRVRHRIIDVNSCFDVQRGQYYSTALLEGLTRCDGAEESCLLGVTALDLFVPIFTFVFGEAQLNGRCALVSCHRLREEFYGLPARLDLLRERLFKEAVHELDTRSG
jgi:archaemetzincin